jgi:hypothetical protein
MKMLESKKSHRNLEYVIALYVHGTNLQNVCTYLSFILFKKSITFKSLYALNLCLIYHTPFGGACLLFNLIASISYHTEYHGSISQSRVGAHFGDSLVSLQGKEVVQLLGGALLPKDLSGFLIAARSETLRSKLRRDMKICE